jgi:A/G-specific adenine glycosylase
VTARQRKISAIVRNLLEWYPKNARDLPWRRTQDPYAIWVSEIMLQQTQVKTVVPFWERWMRELPTIQAAATASPEKIHKLWEGLGYYSRARNLQKAAQIIVKEHGGKFPKDFEAALALPGIGRYTAGAICSIAFNQPTPILDGNVIRVLTRVFGIGENPRKPETNRLLWQIAEQSVWMAKSAGKNSCSHLNQALMELGALICLPRNPQCGVCPVRTSCFSLGNNCIERLPNLGKRRAATVRRFVAFVVGRNGKYLVRQRPAGVVNAHLWEFPNVEVNGEKRDATAIFRSQFGFLAELRPLCALRHSITRYRITIEAFRVEAARRPAIPGGIWRTKRQLQRLAFNSAHKKILGCVSP